MIAKGMRRTLAACACLGILAACKDPPKDDVPKDAKDAARSGEPVDAAPATPAEVVRRPYDDAKVQGLLNPSGLPPYQGPTGSVEGTIVVRGAPPPATTGKRADFARCPEAVETYGTTFRVGGTVGEGRALADAVVAVTGYEGFVPAKSDHVTVHFEGCAYDRRTVLMTFGQRIDVLNKSKKQIVTPDIDGQPVLALRIAAPHSVAPVHLFPPGPGRFHLIDRGVLGYVDEDVYVLMHPLHSATDLKGTYRIDGVPVGKATVNAAHPAFGGDAAKEVTITANVVAKVDLVLTYGEDAGASKLDAGAAVKKDAGKVPDPIR